MRGCDFEDAECDFEHPAQLVPGLVRRWLPYVIPAGAYACRNCLAKFRRMADREAAERRAG